MICCSHYCFHEDFCKGTGVSTARMQLFQHSSKKCTHTHFTIKLNSTMSIVEVNRAWHVSTYSWICLSWLMLLKTVWINWGPSP